MCKSPRHYGLQLGAAPSAPAIELHLKNSLVMSSVQRLVEHGLVG